MFKKIKIGWTLRSGRIKDGKPNNLRETKRALRNSLVIVRDKWAQQVYGGNPLPGCRRIRNREYLESLSEGNAVRTEGNELVGVVIARYKYASDIEHGYPPFDLKPGILAGPKAKQGKNGKYSIVPFRWATPGNTGNSGGFSDLMDGSLYDLGAKQLANRSGQSSPRDEISEGRLQFIDEQSGTGWAVTRSSHTGYEHLRPLAAGIRKEGSDGHHQYQSYRTVSSASDPASWIHPGAPPNPIAKAVEEHMFPVVEKLINEGFRKDIESIFK